MTITESPSPWRKRVFFVVAVAVMAAILLLPTPRPIATAEGPVALSTQGKAALAVLAMAVVLWATEAIPFPVTGLLALVLCAVTHEVKTSAHQVPRGSHLGRVDIGLGHQSTPEEASGLEAIDAVVLGLGPVDGAHVESVAQDEGDFCFRAQVSQPVPVEGALDPHHQVLSKRRHRAEEPLWIAGEVAVEEHLALPIQHVTA